MSTLLRCDSPACTVVAHHPQGLPPGWRVTSNATGHTVHAHNDAHVATAAATSTNPNAATVTALTP